MWNDNYAKTLGGESLLQPQIYTTIRFTMSVSTCIYLYHIYLYILFKLDIFIK